MRNKRFRWINALSLFCLMVLALPFSNTANSAELLMMEQDACPWCERWHSEIGDIYPKTDEGKRAPLRIIDIHDEMPEDLSSIIMERFTPTFVLVEDGKEIGRLRGYTGEEFFWFLLSDMFEKLKSETKKTEAASGQPKKSG